MGYFKNFTKAAACSLLLFGSAAQAANPIGGIFSAPAINFVAGQSIPFNDAFDGTTLNGDFWQAAFNLNDDAPGGFSVGGGQIILDSGLFPVGATGSPNALVSIPIFPAQSFSMSVDMEFLAGTTGDVCISALVAGLIVGGGSGSGLGITLCSLVGLPFGSTDFISVIDGTTGNPLGGSITTLAPGFIAANVGVPFQMNVDYDLGTQTLTVSIPQFSFSQVVPSAVYPVDGKVVIFHTGGGEYNEGSATARVSQNILAIDQVTTTFIVNEPDHYEATLSPFEHNDIQYKDGISDSPAVLFLDPDAPVFLTEILANDTKVPADGTLGKNYAVALGTNGGENFTVITPLSQLDFETLIGGPATVYLPDVFVAAGPGNNYIYTLQSPLDVLQGLLDSGTLPPSTYNQLSKVVTKLLNGQPLSNGDIQSLCNSITTQLNNGNLSADDATTMLNALSQLGITCI